MAPKHYPTVKNSIILLLFLMAIMFALMFILILAGVVTGWMKLNQASDLLIKNPQYMGLINLVAISLLLGWGYKRTKTPFQRVFPLRPVPGWLYLPIGLLMIGLVILLSDMDNLLRWVLHTPPDRNDPLVQLFSSDNIWGLVFVLVLVAPLTEEFLFRGLILTGFSNNYRVSKAIWVSALLFSVFHLNIYQMPGAFVAGLIFAWLVVKTGSLWPSLFGHALTNGLPIIAERVFNLQIPGLTYQLEGQILFQPIWLDGVGLALAGLGILLLAPMLKERLEPAPEIIRNPPPAVETMATGEGEQLAGNPPARSSKLGLASLIIGLFSLMAFAGSFFKIISLRNHDDQSSLAVWGLIIILGLLASIIGLVLGIVGVTKKERMTPAIIGVVFNGFYVLMGILMIVLGALVMLRGGIR